MPPDRTCIFYKRTFNGKRCLLLSIEDWRRRRDRLLAYCQAGGKGCPIYSAYVRILTNNSNNAIIKRKYANKFV